LNRSFESASVVGEGDILQWQVIFDRAFLLIYYDSTTLRVEGSDDTIFCEVDGQLNELFVEIFDRLIRVLIEGLFKRVGNVLVDKSDGGVLLLCGTQVYVIFVGNVFEFVNFLHQKFLFLLISKVVTFLDESLPNFMIIDLQESEWKLGTSHLVYNIAIAKHFRTI